MGKTPSRASATGVFVMPVDRRGQSLGDPVFVGATVAKPTFVSGIALADKEGAIRPDQRVQVFASAINPRARRLVIPAPEQRTNLGTGFLQSNTTQPVG